MDMTIHEAIVRHLYDNYGNGDVEFHDCLTPFDNEDGRKAIRKVLDDLKRDGLLHITDRYRDVAQKNPQATPPYPPLRYCFLKGALTDAGRAMAKREYYADAQVPTMQVGDNSKVVVNTGSIAAPVADDYSSSDVIINQQITAANTPAKIAKDILIPLLIGLFVWAVGYFYQKYDIASKPQTTSTVKH